MKSDSEKLKNGQENVYAFEAIKGKSTRMTGLIDFVSREGMAIVGDLTHETIPQTVTDVDGKPDYRNPNRCWRGIIQKVKNQ